MVEAWLWCCVTSVRAVESEIRESSRPAFSTGRKWHHRVGTAGTHHGANLTSDRSHPRTYRVRVSKPASGAGSELPTEGVYPAEKHPSPTRPRTGQDERGSASQSMRRC